MMDEFWTARMAIDACASAAEDMATDPIHGGDQWLEFADRLRAVSAGGREIRATPIKDSHNG